MIKNSCKEPLADFAKRKAEHIQIALEDKHQTTGLSGLDRIKLIHEALPDINLAEICIKTQSLNLELPSPFLVSSMTAGHKQGEKINYAIAKACEQTGWLMGIGSQRRQLYDNEAILEWIELRKNFPKVKLIGNIGIAQLITSSHEEIEKILAPIQAEAIFVHSNPLQECIQPAGTTEYKGSLSALTHLCKNLNVPVILKETGCGFSKNTLLRLNDIGLYAVDISGLGGTHWGRIEGTRAKNHPLQQKASKVFEDWGISTIDSILNTHALDLKYEIWGSGGIRSGLDAAKLIALGSKIIGFAKPILQAATQSSGAIIEYMRQIEFELKIALFCTGHGNIKSLQENKSWE